ncbi:Bifunctional DNA primase/polymerase, N-terminal [Modestobacter sp. DSM 44400]|nr:Bifunctional DNA primase/polymerase, N-terminal [Modestobacter sp. DSM 44400]
MTQSNEVVTAMAEADAPVIQYTDASFVRLNGRVAKEPGWQLTRLTWPAVEGDDSFGINCGLSGFVVIDCDTKEVDPGDGEGPLWLFGEQSLDDFLWHNRITLPPTFTVRTPRGGVHLYFRMPPGTSLGNQTDWLPGVDYKSTGGYVVAAGSRVAADPSKGKPAGSYEPVDSSVQVADLPDVLLTALRTRQRGDRRGEPIGGNVDDLAGARDDLWDFGSPVGPGERDDVAFRFASSLRNSMSIKTKAKRLMELRHRDFVQPVGNTFLLETALAKVDNAWANYSEPTAETWQTEAAAALVATTPPAPVTPIESPQTRAAYIRSRLLAEDELDLLPEPEFLIGDDLLPADAVGMLIAAPGTGKTLLELDWALCIAAGQPWHGRSVRQGRVLYVYAEGARGLRLRRDAWRAYNGGLIVGSNAMFYPSTVPLLDPGWVSGLVEVVAELSPALVVIDTLARATAGADENSVKDMGRALEAAHAIRESSACAVQLVHHTNRSGEYRGSSAIEAAVTDMMTLSRINPGMVMLRQSKRNDGEPFDDLHLRFEAVEKSGVLVPNDGIRQLLDGDIKAKVRAALAVLRSATAGQITEHTEANTKAVQRALTALMESGDVLRDGPSNRPVYRLAVAL